MDKNEKGKQTAIIHLIGGYAIGIDGMNFSVMKKTGVKKKTNEPAFKYIGFYSSLEKALVACKEDYARRTLIDQDDMSLDEAISIVVRSNNRFATLVKNAFEGVTV